MNLPGFHTGYIWNSQKHPWQSGRCCLHIVSGSHWLGFSFRNAVLP